MDRALSAYAELPYSAKPAFYARGQSPPEPIPGPGEGTYDPGGPLDPRWRYVGFRDEFRAPVPGCGPSVAEYVEALVRNIRDRKAADATLSRTLPPEKLAKEGTAGLRLSRTVPSRFTAHVEVVVTRSGADLFVVAHRYIRVLRGRVTRKQVTLIALVLVAIAIMFSLFLGAKVGFFRAMPMALLVEGGIVGMYVAMIIYFPPARPDGDRESAALAMGTVQMAIAEARRELTTSKDGNRTAI